MPASPLRLLAIPDLHGKTVWQQVNPAAYDKIIFLGDYVDDHGEHSDEEIFDNLLRILAFRQAYPDKVVLLLGNHDVHYLHYPHYRASRFRESMRERLQSLFTRHRAVFQVAYAVGDTLFTHAGVSAIWWEWMQERAFALSLTEDLPLPERLNALMDSLDRRYLYGAGLARQGTYPCGGVVWADFPAGDVSLRGRGLGRFFGNLRRPAARLPPGGRPHAPAPHPPLRRRANEHHLH